MKATAAYTPALLAQRWARWQQTSLVQRGLRPYMDPTYYTVLYVPDDLRETFFVLVDVLLVHQELARALPQLSAYPTGEPVVEEVRTAWQDWQAWTRRLVAYTARVAAGQEGRCPPVPDAVAARLPSGQTGGNGAASPR